MGEFGYQPHIRLLDQHLTLDPEIVSMMGEIEAQMAARRILQDMLRPNWSLLMPHFQSIVSSPSSDIFRTPSSTPPPSIWTSPQGAGPATSRAGELSDVTGALYQTNVVQRLVGLAHDEGYRQIRLFRTEWSNGSTGNRIATVTMGGLVVAGLITPIIANQQTRDLAFGLIKGRDIPIPGVDGLSFQILDRGGAVTTPLGVPGLTGNARLQFPNSAAPSYEVMVNFDVMEFLRSRSSR